MSDEQAPKPPLTTLTEFIEKYQKVIATIGVFVALALFWKNIRPGSTPYISYLCLLVTIPLFWEVWKGYDYEKSSWNLIVFVNAFNGVFFWSLYYLIADYPDYLEKILLGIIFLSVYLFLITFVQNRIRRQQIRDYEKRVAIAKKAEENKLPIEKRNEIVTALNKSAARLHRANEVFTLILAIAFFLLAGLIATLTSNYLHATFDLIWNRTPEMALPHTPSPKPTVSK